MKSKTILWLALFVIVLTAFAFIAIPVWLIKPFSPQTTRDIATSFALKSWSPFVTTMAALLSIVIAIWLWRRSKNWWSKTVLFVPLFIVMICVWFARQNHFEWMFNPLTNSSYATMSDANFVDEKDMLITVELNGEAAAYPIRQMAYHHVVEDVVGGVPVAVTY
jgi:thiol:disulfide interchange protein